MNISAYINKTAWFNSERPGLLDNNVFTNKPGFPGISLLSNQNFHNSLNVGVENGCLNFYTNNNLAIGNNRNYLLVNALSSINLNNGASLDRICLNDMSSINTTRYSEYIEPIGKTQLEYIRNIYVDSITTTDDILNYFMQIIESRLDSIDVSKIMKQFEEL